MFRASLPIHITALLCGLLIAVFANAQPITGPMKQVYDAFIALQPYLADEGAFNDQENAAKISGLIKELRSNFHSVESFKTKYNRQPGFKQNLGVVTDTLGDSFNRFAEGKKDYALWRLRAVSNNCFTCHSSYNVDLKFHDDSAPELMNDADKANFYLATRQSDKAKEILLKLIAEPKYEIRRMSTIRKWLVLETRTSQSASAALAFLVKFQESLKTPQSDKDTISQWITSLKRWNSEKPPAKKSVASAANLIKHAAKEDGMFLSSVDEIAFLRATAMLHALLADEVMPPEQRSRALLLLGYSYVKLPLFFIDELPEIYLEQCIDEFPGSDDAKESYRIYKDKIELDFTGSAGTQIPVDIIVRLKELHDKAYDIPRFDGKV